MSDPAPQGPIVFLASQTVAAQAARAELVALYGDAPLAQAGVIVALGGDGFMLETLHATQARDVPVYGMNRGTVGFLLNDYAVADLPARVAADASALYARNVLDFLKLVVDAEGALKIDLEDEIVKACLVARDGQVLRS